MSDIIEKTIKTLPDNPGVYIMHAEDDTVIYVGKAKNLKNRVTQYFRSGKNHTPKVRAMVANIHHFEYIVTDTELEALVLECNLIKKHMPRYNILLKDDKHYPYEYKGEKEVGTLTARSTLVHTSMPMWQEDLLR